MNVSDTEGVSASGAVVSSTENPRLTGSWLIVARAVWLVLVVPSLGLFVISLPAFYQQVQRACVGIACTNLAGALTARELQALSPTGFSLSEYAAVFTIFFAIITCIWCAVGFLIFWRRSDDWLALLAAFFLVMFTLTPSGGNPTYVLALASPVFTLPFGLVTFLGRTSLFAFFLLFPNGRLAPRWMGVVLLLAIIEAFFSSFPSPTSFATNWPGWLSLLVIGVLVGALLSAQIYRYRRLSTPVQRQQTKWIVLGVTAFVGFLIVASVLSFFPSSPSQDALGEAIGTIVVGNILWPIALLLIPLSIGFSILRYRLYAIDVLINRTLVYGTLTVSLALLYFGLIFALQSLFQGITKQNNDVAIVVSTLVIAALFQPLRHRLQQIIDRRFYRRKYDARRIIANFSTTLRGEVELTELSERLVAVVEETMQPTHVSLWLNSPRKAGYDVEKLSDSPVS